MVRGEPREQAAAVARAIELGVTYFDTAAQYGDGLSEQNLGRALREARADVLVGTKLRFGRPELQAGPGCIRELFEVSLARLGRERVDILFYHGRVGIEGERSLTVAELLGPLLDVLRRFREEGRARFLGFTGLGDTTAILNALQPDGYDVFHCYFSAINPSAAFAMPPGFAQQNLHGLMPRAAEIGMGVFAIRIMAAGALAGIGERHPLASPEGAPLIQGVSQGADARQAELLRPVALELGISLPELGVRFALSSPEVSCALVGISDVSQLEEAARAASAGPLPARAVQRILDVARSW